MKSLIAFLVFFGFIGGGTWWECHRAADRFQMCRALGHGTTYCALAEITR